MTDSLVPYQPAVVVPYSEMERMAVAIAKSQLFGFKTPEQVLAVMLIASAEGLHPAIAMRDYDVIQGRPAKKAEAMLRSFLSSSGTVKWHALTDELADATFSHPQGGEIRITWDMPRARKAELAQKDNYKKFPRAMLRSRCISEGVRTIWPMATGGMHVPEEVMDYEEARDVTPEKHDITPAQPARSAIDRIVKEKRKAETAVDTQAPDPPAEPEKPKRTRTATKPETAFDAVDLLRKMEGARSVEELQLYGEQAKTAPDKDKTILRDIFIVMLKKLKATPMEQPAPVAAVVTDALAQEEPWI